MAKVKIVKAPVDTGPILTDSYYWVRGVPEEYTDLFKRGYKVFIPYKPDGHPTLVITNVGDELCRARAATQEDLELIYESLD